jgi:hypothetical protein
MFLDGWDIAAEPSRKENPLAAAGPASGWWGTGDIEMQDSPEIMTE